MTLPPERGGDVVIGTHATPRTPYSTRQLDRLAKAVMAPLGFRPRRGLLRRDVSPGIEARLGLATSHPRPRMLAIHPMIHLRHAAIEGRLAAIYGRQEHDNPTAVRHLYALDGSSNDIPELLVSDEESAYVALNQVRDRMTTHGFPWLEAQTDLRELARTLADIRQLERLVLVHVALGDLAEAARTIEWALENWAPGDEGFKKLADHVAALH